MTLPINALCYFPVLPRPRLPITLHAQRFLPPSMERPRLRRPESAKIRAVLRSRNLGFSGGVQIVVERRGERPVRWRRLPVRGQHLRRRRLPRRPTRDPGKPGAPPSGSRPGVRREPRRFLSRAQHHRLQLHPPNGLGGSLHFDLLLKL